MASRQALSTEGQNQAPQSPNLFQQHGHVLPSAGYEVLIGGGSSRQLDIVVRGSYEVRTTLVVSSLDEGYPRTRRRCIAQLFDSEQLVMGYVLTLHGYPHLFGLGTSSKPS
jgi:hypothetical protein